MIRILNRLLKSAHKKQTEGEVLLQENQDLQTQQFVGNLDQNRQAMKERFRNCSDVTYRPIQLQGQMKALLIYIDGMVDTVKLEENVLKPLLIEGLPQELNQLESFEEFIHNQAIATRQTKLTSFVWEAVQEVLNGHVAIFAAGENQVLLADLQGFEKRQITEPETESVVRGPREGFTESLRTNTSLLRRKVRSSRLKIESVTLGEVSRTDVALAYIEGIAQDSILEEVRKRVSRIQIDAVLDSEYIEEFIEDAPFSVFPTVQNTERPDVVLANLLEGKIAIIVDGSPFVLIVPMTFWSVIQAAEDYYEHFIYTTSIRWLRFILLCASFLLPSLYVASTTFHPQLIPTELLLSIAAAREGVPFPAVVEAILMEVMFEALREAGIRLPKPVGSAVSMVGALVIGESAVRAGIVSAPVVIVVAFTGIASFALPRYNLGLAFRVLRFPLLILGGTLGFYGIGLGLIALLIHLVNLRSFGVPYMSPVSPQIPGNLKDILIRAPRWAMVGRPTFFVGRDKKRIPEGQKPGPQRGKTK
ncbi:spore germination protein KA [Paenibacillus tianmuensis]|uniref:Spore germination protein KA n=1 Tax=Paenibacillus tianmuensis TaxID=624147 RepID=A0A1G4QZV9_9BACL|nr:spore germination protein [Paenibacillus tianmuensis]SCW49945.1 spore germination protein KA [Paenibacillus tianmuensis]